MTTEAIKDFKIKTSYTKLIEKKLFSYLWEWYLKPMFEIVGVKPKARNELPSALIEALKDGPIKTNSFQHSE